MQHKRVRPPARPRLAQVRQVRPILNTESLLYFATRQVLDRPIATFAARQPRAYQVAAPNGSIAEGADQTRKRNREAVRDGRWNAVPISNYRRLDE